MKTSKALRTAVNLLLQRRYPVSLVHFVTDNCNARCPFCFIDFDHPVKLRDQMTLDQIERMVRQVGPCLSNVNLTGGEPFLRKDLKEITDLYLRLSGVQTIFITSHGGFPDRVLPFAEELSARYPGRKLIFSFSLDDFEERHNEIRRIPGLFSKTMESYCRLSLLGRGVMVNISITVSQENCDSVLSFYRHLRDERSVQSVTANIVRTQGVYAIPEDQREKILKGYAALQGEIFRDMKSGRMQGYDASTLEGRLLNKKNEILSRNTIRTFRTNEYISPCHAGSLFGVIGSEGTVYPCEILDRPLGNLKDYDFDFLRLWADTKAKDLREFVRETECRCTYGCAWTFNILGNWRYQPELAASAVGLKT